MFVMNGIPLSLRSDLVIRHFKYHPYHINFGTASRQYSGTGLRCVIDIVSYNIFNCHCNSCGTEDYLFECSIYSCITDEIFNNN